MNWTSLIGPAVVAAAISGLVSTIGIWISAQTSRGIHSEKLAFDREQAERRFVREVEVTEARIKADAALAEKRFALDQSFAAWKRKAEFAEEVLADFYEARAVISWVRSPLVLAGEGSTRQPEPGETEEETRALNTYYATIERLKSKDEFFAKLYARSYRFSAYFGETSCRPYDALLAIQRRLTITTRTLIDTYADRKEGNLRTERVAWRRIISGLGPDDSTPGELDNIVQDVETICRPAILGEP